MTHARAPRPPKVVREARELLRLMTNVCVAGANKMRLGAEICRFAGATGHADYLLKHAEMLEGLAKGHLEKIQGHRPCGGKTAA